MLSASPMLQCFHVIRSGVAHVAGKSSSTRLKNGTPIWLPLYPEVNQALSLPHPRGAEVDSKYSSGEGPASPSGLSTPWAAPSGRFSARVALSAIATGSATRLLPKSLGKAALSRTRRTLPGDSTAVVSKYYAKWSVSYQERTVKALERVHGTLPAHNENDDASLLFATSILVPGVGLEPTLPLRRNGF